ncbi:acyl-CoA dehydrogenase [Pseudorhodoferax soli]|nr:acyl-CoA dehydrogenase [Pseudorhodoferax soli]
MSETTSMVRDAVARLLKDRASPEGTLACEADGLDANLWDQFELLGLRGDETGMDVGDKVAVLVEIGRAGALIPFADSEMLGRALAQSAGLALGHATLTAVPRCLKAASVDDGHVQIDFAGAAVPWGRHAERVLALCTLDGKQWVAGIEGAALEWVPGRNLAGEPRDTLEASLVRVAGEQLHPANSGVDSDLLESIGALCRCASTVGALESAMHLSVQYAQDRQQFGKPIGHFQVIQSYLAEMTCEVCAASMALEMAVMAATSGASWEEVAVAKVRAAQAANIVAKLAHQVHGAIGMTQEYSLQIWTRRLWSWREEYGNEMHWSRLLGNRVIAAGGDAFWPGLSDARMSTSGVEGVV